MSRRRHVVETLALTAATAGPWWALSAMLTGSPRWALIGVGLAVVGVVILTLFLSRK